MEGSRASELGLRKSADTLQGWNKTGILQPLPFAMLMLQHLIVPSLF